MKNILLFIILSIAFIPNVVFAENLTPSVNPNEKIYDYADLLNEYQEKELYELVDSFIDKYNMDLVLVTIDKNPYGVSDYYSQLYAHDFYDYNNFGKGSTYDGLLILIDMDNRYPFISTTGNAILVFDDSRINAMHDSAYSYLKSGDYYIAFKSYINRADEYAQSGVASSNELYCIDAQGNPYKCKTAPKSVNWGMCFVLSILGSLLALIIHLRKYKGIKLATNANTYMEKVEREPNVDQFVTTFTSRVKRYHDDGGSGHGGFGGGSSISFGSSGRSHGGGGGRHF